MSSQSFSTVPGRSERLKAFEKAFETVLEVKACTPWGF